LSSNETSYEKAFELDGDESLAAFLRCLRKFDRAFCDAMFDGVDFTLKLEIRGDKHKMLHSRVTTDRFERSGKKHEEQREK
jgi:hypothetical protein